MRTALKIAGSLVGLLILALLGVYGWASWASSGILSDTYEVQRSRWVPSWAPI